MSAVCPYSSRGGRCANRSRGLEARATGRKRDDAFTAQNATTIRAKIVASDMLSTNHFDSTLDLEQTLMRYVSIYTTRNSRSQP